MKVHGFQYEHRNVMMNVHGVKKNLESLRLQGHGATCLKVIFIGLKSWETIISNILAKGRGAYPYAQA